MTQPVSICCLTWAIPIILSNPDSNIIISQQAYELAGKLQPCEEAGKGAQQYGTGYATLGDYPKATQMFFRSLRISESLHDVPNIVRVYNNLGDTYMRQGDYRKALDNLLPANKQWTEYFPQHKSSNPMTPNGVRLIAKHRRKLS